MTRKPESLKDWSSTIKNIVQIIAIIVAAIWTYNKFVRGEAPSLEPRATASADLTWEATDGNESCIANLFINVKNEGITSFDISKFRIRAWRFDRIKKQGEFATPLKLDEIQSNKQEKFFDETYTSVDVSPDSTQLPSFIRHYSPSFEFGHSYQWILDKVPHKWVLEFKNEVQLWAWRKVSKLR